MDHTACGVKHIDVAAAELPLCCPNKGQKVWNAHPRVYLDIKATGQVTCPYCGTQYQLVDA
jgi:uncharacterized Zn-finger protein